MPIAGKMPALQNDRIKFLTSISILNLQFSPLSPHSSILSPQHSVLNTQSSALSPQHSVLTCQEAITAIDGTSEVFCSLIC